MPTIGDALFQSSQQLLDAGIDTGSLEASLLLGRATGFDRLRLINRTAEPLDERQWKSFQELMARRLKREPLQYILGETEFMGLAFHVTPAVLIPRADTESLVETVLDLEEERGETAPTSVADIGTGSGAIAIALATSLPYMRVTATDVSEAALAVARSNAVRNGVEGQVTFRQGDGLAALEGPVRYLISNPPYIPQADIPGLEPEVRDYEPHLALTPGDDGYQWYRTFATEGARFVEPGGYLALEVGHDQAAKVIELLEAAGAWETPETRQDLGRIDRVVYARRKAD